MPKPNFSIYLPKHVLTAALLALVGCLLLTGPISASESNPLQPIDTSSPRATLQGFLDSTNKCFLRKTEVVNSYLGSQRLYPTPEEEAGLQDYFNGVESSERVLDLSELPPATIRESSRRLVIQLKEILDRIPLPPLESIPDEPAMEKAEFKHWTIPGTEIRIARVEKGPRTGEYLFTAKTVERIPEFFLKVKDRPYKPGASVGWYEDASASPTGVANTLHRIVPARWVLDMGKKFRIKFLDQPLWRWFGIFVVLSAGLAFILLCRYLSGRLAKRGALSKRWAHLLQALSVVMVTPTMVSILAEVLRITGIVYQTLTLLLWIVFYLALTWSVWVGGAVVAESVISHERLRVSSIDSQLIRLALRLVTIVLAIAIFVTGAERIGLPAYSVVAGLGVGGLAVALAAQQTLANLLGSIIIMIEKPFVVGNWIKIKDMEGVVENVGFRSTRLRTFYDSVVTIPSSQMVSSTIDNMELRKFRQVKTVIKLTYDTPAETVEGFVEGTERILQAHPDTRKDNIRVVLNDFGPNGLEIQLSFFLSVPDKKTEVTERQRILLGVLRLAESMGIRFAVST